MAKGAYASWAAFLCAALLVPEIFTGCLGEGMADRSTQLRPWWDLDEKIYYKFLHSKQHEEENVGSLLVQGFLQLAVSH